MFSNVIFLFLLPFESFMRLLSRDIRDTTIIAIISTILCTVLWKVEVVMSGVEHYIYTFP